MYTKAQALADAGNQGKVGLSVGLDLLNKNTAFRDELLACKTPAEADAVFAKYEGIVRAQIAPEKVAEA